MEFMSPGDAGATQKVATGADGSEYLSDLY